MTVDPDQPADVGVVETRALGDFDVDSLANERTLLAWTRTGFTLIATGSLVLHTTEFQLIVRELAIGTATIALGVVVWGLGFVRFRAGERVIGQADPRIPLGIVRAVAAAATLVAVGAFCIAVLPAR